MSIPKPKGSGTGNGGSHYFAQAPAAQRRPGWVSLAVGDRHLQLRTDSGLFSGGRVDPGTRVLLGEAPPPPPTGNILDLGCGYGPIAVAVAVRAPQARVWAVDVNERALELAQLNAEAAALSNVDVRAPDDVPAGLGFAAIYSNPPVRIGKLALHELLLRWLPRLEEDAPAYLVVQTHLGSDSLARWLESKGWTVRRLASKRSYRVLEVHR